MRKRADPLGRLRPHQITPLGEPIVLGDRPSVWWMVDLAHSPDGRILAVGSDDQTVRLLAP
ncbi:hypothetical protein [Parafrankia sp. FMc2]|uniref:hypothetical protein n=1 Tax=Parafrankia sp. FMc2 TaxID=3233196 RepID=UPI0034D4EB07